MTITITRKDWKRGLCYYDSCGCLLHRAILRHTHRDSSVMPGYVDIRKNLTDYAEYTYDTKIEARLKAAHRDPSLLPITITLR